jgi:hypothetical protein
VSSRQYSSFLLRFWLINDTANGKPSDNTASSLVLQLQNLQTGTTWRLNSLEELNTLLGKTIEKSEMLVPGGPVPGKILPTNTRLDTEVE